MKFTITLLLSLITITGFSQNNTLPPVVDPRVYDIIDDVSADRLEQDITILANFGTRNTLSDTVSETRGIGAARRWIKAEFDKISKDCGGCLDVYYQRSLLKAEDSRRIPEDTWIVNVVAVQKGNKNPNNYIIMSGDIDSRASNVIDAEIDAPGANDNASGMAGAIEAARVLSKYEFPSSIMYVGLSGEEQGLFGGAGLAKQAKEEGWNIIGVLNNDMIGNIEGVDGVIENNTFRVFSEPTPVTETEQQRRARRYFGGEVDGVSRQLARYIARMAKLYMPNLDAMMIYRLDRFGRGGHHTPFNNEGFAAVRIMETHENYNRQHQDIRTEDGIEYGDVIEGVNFDYAKKLTAVNAITMAALAWAPPAPEEVKIGGAVRPSTTLSWTAVENTDLAAYKIYWRETTAPQWENFRYVDPSQTSYKLENLVIDNYFFGVSAVGKDGNESVVVFPSGLIRN